MLDHLIYAVPALAKAVAELAQRLGVRPTMGGKHVGIGTQNALLSLSEETYLEVIGPDLDQPPPERPRPFDIDTLTAPRLAGWVAKARDLDRQAEQARSRGYDFSPVISMSRELPDGTRLDWRLTFPAQPLGDGLVPALIDWGASLHPAKTSARGCTLVEWYGEHTRPETVRPILEAMGLMLDIRQGLAPALVAILDTPKGRVTLR